MLLSSRSTGFVPGFCNTVTACLLKPADFFHAASRSTDAFMAWTFGMITGSLGMIFSFLWGIAFSMKAQETLYGMGISVSGMHGTNMYGLLLAPLIISGNIVVLSAYCHIILRLFSRQKKPFSATFRNMCYATSPALFNAVPIVGNVISAVWALYLVVTGEAILYRLGRIRTFVLLLLPVMLISLIFVLVLISVAAAGIFAIGYFKDFLEFVL